LKNEGKRFEECFAKSVPKGVWHKRLNDNAASWSGGTNSRFTSSNECDFLLHDSEYGLLYGLELKSTKGSLTFWREDFEDKSKKQTFNIRKKQIQGLQTWSENYSGVFGFVINFRNETNDTYFISIKDFLEYSSTLPKKSLNKEDILQMNPIKIESKKLKINYRYDLIGFLVGMGERQYGE